MVAWTKRVELGLMRKVQILDFFQRIRSKKEKS